MSAGKYRERITVKRNVATGANAANEPTSTPQEVMSRWGAIESGGSKEFSDAARIHAQLTHLVRLQYDPEAATITSVMWLVWGTKTLEILGPPRIDPDRKEILLDCVERE